MACNISMTCVIEQVHGLPQGTIARVGGEEAARLVEAIDWYKRDHPGWEPPPWPEATGE